MRNGFHIVHQLRFVGQGHPTRHPFTQRNPRAQRGVIAPGRAHDEFLVPPIRHEQRHPVQAQRSLGGVEDLLHQGLHLLDGVQGMAGDGDVANHLFLADQTGPLPSVHQSRGDLGPEDGENLQVLLAEGVAALGLCIQHTDDLAIDAQGRNQFALPARQPAGDVPRIRLHILDAFRLARLENTAHDAFAHGNL